MGGGGVGPAGWGRGTSGAGLRSSGWAEVRAPRPSGQVGGSGGPTRSGGQTRQAHDLQTPTRGVCTCGARARACADGRLPRGTGIPLAAAQGDPANVRHCPRSPEWGLGARPCPRGPPSGVRGPGKGLGSRGGGSQGEVRRGARPSGPQSGRPWWRRKAMEMALELGRPVCPVCSHQPCMGGSVCGVFGRVDPAPPRATPGARPLSSSQTGWFLSGGAPSHHLSLGKPEGLASFPLDPDLVGDLKRPHPGPPGPFPAVKGPPPPHSQGRQ